jgi:hypothetical protein
MLTKNIGTGARRAGSAADSALQRSGLRNVKSTPQVISPPYQVFLRLTAGFLNVAILRGDLVQAEVDAWLADIVEMAAADVLTNGAGVFTAIGEKPA